MNPKIKFLLERTVHSISTNSLDSARLYLSQAIKIEPKNSEVNRLFGVLSYFNGDHQSAMQYFDKAIEFNQRNSNAFTNKATLLSEYGYYDESINYYYKALELDKKNVETLNNLGNTLKELERYDESLDSYKKAIELKPNYAEAYSNLGNAFQELKRYDEAIANYRRAIELKPIYAEAYSNLATTWQEMKHYTEAIACYQKALELKPNDAETYSRFGKLLSEIGNSQLAREYFLLAVKMSPDYAEAHLNLACSYLEHFEFEQGWPEYEWRTQIKDNKRFKFQSSKPIWNGEESNSRLLIVSEQGIGDQILHGTMLQEFKNSSHRITVALDKKLIQIFSRSFPQHQFIDRNNIDAGGDYDEYTLIGSLGNIFRRNLNEFEKNAPYLIQGDDKKRKVDQGLNKEKIYCGLAWKSTNAKVGANKSLHLPELLPILQLSGIEFINLQYGDVSEDVNQLSAEYQAKIDLVDSIDKFTDIDALVSLIDRCSFVITTSNSTAHLSGALGKKTFLLLPFSAGKFWYWHSKHNQSIWYPSVRIFQQKQDGDWSEPIKQIKAFLEEKSLI